ncbi:hypothetical protein AURDEDRAFT_119771 [Auricularia subglabra TFB-10046 SS5]|nr:hypothetical protein AURDEDRAFT_119771 [Auricularia subglabra TFB-10046 SS5]
MDPPRLLQSFVSEHNALCDLVCAFLRERRFDAVALAAAAELARSVHLLLRRANERYLVFPAVELETFRGSCQAMLRRLNVRAREIQASPVPTSPYGPHTPPSSPLARATPSPESEDEAEYQHEASPAVKLVAYAIFDTVSGTILGICMSPEAEGDIRLFVRTRVDNSSDEDTARQRQRILEFIAHVDSANDLFAPADLARVRLSCDQMVNALDDFARQQRDPPLAEISVVQSVPTGGRPRKVIDPEFLKYLSKFRGPRGIARALGISARTVRRQQLALGIGTPQPPVFLYHPLRPAVRNLATLQSRAVRPPLSDHDLDTLVGELMNRFPNHGRSQIHGLVHGRGHNVTRAMVSASMTRITGIPGHFGRIPIRPKKYRVNGPGSLWHHDGQHDDEDEGHGRVQRLLHHVGAAAQDIPDHQRNPNGWGRPREMFEPKDHHILKHYPKTPIFTLSSSIPMLPALTITPLPMSTPLLLIFAAAGGVPRPFTTNPVFIHANVLAHEFDLLPSLAAILRDVLQEAPNAGPARDLVLHVMQDCPSAQVWTGSSMLPANYRFSPAHNTPPLGRATFHGSIGAILDGRAAAQAPRGCYEPASFIAQLRTTLGSRLSLANPAGISVHFIFFQHFMLRDPARPRIPVPASAGDAAEPPGARTPAQPAASQTAERPTRRLTLPPAQPVAEAPAATSARAATPATAAAEDNTSGHDTPDFLLQAIRSAFPKAALDIARCLPFSMPPNQRGRRRRNPFAAEYGTAYASWRIHAHIQRTCEALSLDVREPSRSRMVSFPSQTCQVCCWDVLRAFDIPASTWNSAKTRFSGLHGAAARLQAAATDEARSLFHKLSFFLQDVSRVDPLADPAQFVNEDAIWEWGTEAFRRDLPSHHPLWDPHTNAITLYDGFRNDGSRRIYMSDQQLQVVLAAAAGGSQASPESAYGSCLVDADGAPLQPPLDTGSWKDFVVVDKIRLLSSELHECVVGGDHHRDLRSKPIARDFHTLEELALVGEINEKKTARAKRAKRKRRRHRGGAAQHALVAGESLGFKPFHHYTFDEARSLLDFARQSFLKGIGTWLCLDVEATKSHELTEVGMARLRHVSHPGRAGYRLRDYSHIIIQETGHLRRPIPVRRAKGDGNNPSIVHAAAETTGQLLPPFLYGTSRTLPMAAFRSMFNVRLTQAVASGPLFVVCHDQYLERLILGKRLALLPEDDNKDDPVTLEAANGKFICYLDTQVSLMKMAGALSVDATVEGWHNAGNDAKWTLDSLERILCHADGLEVIE